VSQGLVPPRGIRYSGQPPRANEQLRFVSKPFEIALAPVDLQVRRMGRVDEDDAIAPAKRFEVKVADAYVSRRA
jgi:hypothetical protein